MAYISMKRFQGCQQMQHLNCTLEQFEERIRSLTQIATYCLIVHDKDIKDDGTPKAPHIHFVVTLNNTMTLGRIAETLGLPQQYIEKIKGSTRTMQAYLTHFNNPEKHQYDAAAVHANFDYQKKVIDALNNKIETKESEFDFEQIRPLILNGTLREYNLFDEIPLEWYSYSHNQKQVKACFEAYRMKRLNEIDGKDGNMEVIFITGNAGSGKTTLAKQLAKKAGMQPYVSSSGENFMDDYRGQPCIILDDIRGSDMKLNAMLKLLDNNTRTAVKARYANKVLTDCELIIITSTVPPEQFYRAVFESDGEEIEQFTRRLSEVYSLTNENLSVLCWKDGKYQTIATTDNPIKRMYPTEKNKVAESLRKAEARLKDIASEVTPTCWEQTAMK